MFTKTQVTGQVGNGAWLGSQGAGTGTGHSLYCCSFSVYSESELCRCFLERKREAGLRQGLQLPSSGHLGLTDGQSIHRGGPWPGAPGLRVTAASGCLGWGSRNNRRKKSGGLCSPTRNLGPGGLWLPKEGEGDLPGQQERSRGQREQLRAWEYLRQTTAMTTTATTKMSPAVAEPTMRGSCSWSCWALEPADQGGARERRDREDGQAAGTGTGSGRTYLSHWWSQTQLGDCTGHSRPPCELGPGPRSGHRAAAHPAARSSSGWSQWRRCPHSAMPAGRKHPQVCPQDNWPHSPPGSAHGALTWESVLPRVPCAIWGSPQGPCCPLRL